MNADARTRTNADARARMQTYGHGRRRTCTNAHVRMGTDADVHARSRTDADVLWDLSERMRTHVNERTQALGGRTGEKKMTSVRYGVYF